MTGRRAAARVAVVLLGSAWPAACVHVPLRERAAFRLDEYFASHGEIAPSVADAMRRGHVTLGMDEEQVFAVLGEPVRRTRKKLPAYAAGLMVTSRPRAFKRRRSRCAWMCLSRSK